MFIPANHDLYEAVSENIMNIIRKYSNKFEQLSIDEACIDISKHVENISSQAQIFAVKLQEDIKNSEKLTCSIGVGPNKLIAKMENEQLDAFVLVPGSNFRYVTGGNFHLM